MNMTSFIKKRVALILKDDSLRQLIQLFINGDRHFIVVAESSGYKNVDSFVSKTKPDVLIMDLQFAKGSNGIDAIVEIKKASPHCLILALSEIKRPDVVFASFRAGASSYILKKRDVHREIVASLNDLCQGGAPLSSEISKMVIKSFHVNGNSELSRRESEVLSLLSEGKTYSEIAEELLIAKETSKTHIKHIYHKLKVNSKHEAIAIGAEKRIFYNPNIRTASA